MTGRQTACLYWMSHRVCWSELISYHPLSHLTLSSIQTGLSAKLILPSSQQRGPSLLGSVPHSDPSQPHVVCCRWQSAAWPSIDSTVQLIVTMMTSPDATATSHLTQEQLLSKHYSQWFRKHWTHSICHDVTSLLFQGTGTHEPLG